MSCEFADPERHRARHVELHNAFDELLTDFFAQTEARIRTPIVELMEWSHAQTLLPTVRRGSFVGPRPIPHAIERIAQQDLELIDWLLGVANNQPVEAGSFLHAMADAALRADHENYPLLRPALLELKKKYPQYQRAEEKSA